MTRFFRLLLLSSLFLLPISTIAQSKIKPFFIIQLTDPQMGFISGNQGVDEEIELYTKAVKFVNKVKPKFVVITGDFVNNRTDTLQINAFKQITSTIKKKIPVYLIPGNHDISQKPTKQSIDFYNHYYDSDRFDFVYKNVQMIGINSCFINSNIEEETSQFEWLKQTLDQNPKGLRRIVFSHHPFFTKNIEEKDSYSNISQPKRNLYMDLFNNNNVKFVFAGHYHNNSEGSYKNVKMITTSAVGKQLGKAKPGFRIIKVYPDSISHEYIELDNLPKKVKL